MSPHSFFLQRELPSPVINPTWHFQGDDHSVRSPCWYCFSIGVPSISYFGGWGRRVAKTVPRALPDSLIFVARMWRMPLPLGKEEGVRVKLLRGRRRWSLTGSSGSNDREHPVGAGGCTRFMCQRLVLFGGIVFLLGTSKLRHPWGQYWWSLKCSAGCR